MRKLKIDFTMTTTALVTTIGIIALAIYDLIAVMWVDNVSISVSRFLLNTVVEAPFFSFGLGYVCGHLTGYMKPIKAKDLES